jgi:MFS family permease
LKVLGPALLFIVAVAIYGLGQRGTDSFGNQYFVIGRGIEFAEATFLFISLRVAGLVSAPLFGRLSDKYNRKKVLVALVLVESVSLYAVTVTPTALVAVPCVVFGFAAFGLLGVGEALLADITPEAQRSMVFGLNYSASFSSSIYLPPALGWVADNVNFNVGFMLLSAIMPLSILFILKIKNESAARPQSAKQ